VKQNYKAKDNVFRTISIDHEIPFEEAKSFEFPFSNDWQTIVFGDETPYHIYLEKGKHVIGLEVDNDPYVDLVNVIQDIMTDINDLSLQIKRLVGGNTDQYRDWVIVDYIPDVEEKLLSMAERLKSEHKRYTENGYNERAQVFTTMKRVVDVFETLGEDPDELPKKLSVLSEGAGSALQTLSDLIIEIQRQPLLMDQLYVYSDEEELPNYHVGLTTKMTHSVKRFVHSFVPQEKDEIDEDEIVLDVWVNRGRYYVDLLQKHIDSDFTPKTGIKVNLSLMPSEQKLILANSSGVQPDISLGVSSGIPYEFAVRNAALDLRQFEDFDAYSKQFTPGALMRYVIDDSVYAMPETQDFNVVFYRTDILGSLGIDVPQTWNEVIEILPELQRNGMNFYSPLGSANGYKSFMTTAPFIYQFGGNIYHANGMETALNSKESLEGIKMMTDLFGIYGLPLQVPNFYNHFRSGILPIGIGNFSDYLRLKYAAPELEGSWAIAPHPGVENEHGTIERWASGAGQASMIFSKTKYPEESWEFLKWWMSTDVQVKYANELQMIYGEEFVWNSANIEAFMSLPWDTEDKKIIATQWEWLIEVPNIPGGYMAERELSNAWNKIIFDDENPRSAIDDAINIVNREIKRKLEEFGYTQNGELIKPYEVPTIEKIESWVNE
ncbi:MAG: extracellular solute-binding protein, partial [Turicibacter sp.]